MMSVEKSPLRALLPKIRQSILAATLMRPEKSWYTSELARHLGVTPSSLQRELRGLANAGILRIERRGRMGFYQANVDSPIYSDLYQLLLKTTGLVDVIKEALTPAVKAIRFAFVYGSMAAGTADTNSDVDLMVVGEVAPAELSVLTAKATERLRRQVNATTYSTDEFRRKRAAKHHFLSAVLDKPKLFVIGTERDLDGPAQQ